MTFEERISHMLDWEMDAPLYSSLLVMLIVLILGIIVGFLARRGLKKKTYLERPKGLLYLAELYTGYIEKFVEDNMGEENKAWSGYIFTLFIYLIVAFNISLLGLPSVIDWLAAPLSLSVIMFVLIQATAIRHQHFGYFHRYIEPIFVFLPINLVTMWSPIISTTMRLVGNCLAGTVIIGLVQWALSEASGAIFNLMGGLTDLAHANYVPFWDVDQGTVWTQIFLAPIPMGILNLYFSLFSSVVQTLVFASLNALWIAQEIPEKDVSGVIAERPPQTPPKLVSVHQ